MTFFSLPTFFKFLVGIFLLQGATALLLMTAQDVDLNKSVWLIGSLGILIGVLAALWFTAITSHVSEHSYTRASEKFNRQRDRIRLKADKEKTKEIRSGHQQVLRETRRLQTRSTVKLGVALTGVAGLGVLLLFTQFMTLGLLAVSATGGAMLGYGIRARQYKTISPADNAVDSFSAKPVGQGRVLAGEKVARGQQPE